MDPFRVRALATSRGSSHCSPGPEAYLRNWSAWIPHGDSAQHGHTTVKCKKEAELKPFTKSSLAWPEPCAPSWLPVLPLAMVSAWPP